MGGIRRSRSEWRACAIYRLDGICLPLRRGHDWLSARWLQALGSRGLADGLNIIALSGEWSATRESSLAGLQAGQAEAGARLIDDIQPFSRLQYFVQSCQACDLLAPQAITSMRRALSTRRKACHAGTYYPQGHVPVTSSLWRAAVMRDGRQGIDN